MERPLDALSALKGKEVNVLLKDGTNLKGKLEAFDIHTNIVLSEATSGSNKVGQIFVRGDMVTYIN